MARCLGEELPGGVDWKAGSRSLIAEWGYPDVGIVISSDGHTAFMLDYSQFGLNGEPRVIHVDVDDSKGPRVVVLSNDFEEFLRKLVAD